MKKIITVLVMSCCFAYAFSQNSLSVCAFVDANGSCILSNTKFISQPDSSRMNLYLHVKADNTFAGTSKIIYKIYSVSKTGAEKLENTIDQTVQATWMFGWLPHVFSSPGKFNIKVYNDANKLLCSKSVELISGK